MAATCSLLFAGLHATDQSIFQAMPSLPVVRFEVFRGTFASWPELFEQAAQFATLIGRDRLITISHSEDKDDGVIAVWYWEDSPREASIER